MIHRNCLTLIEIILKLFYFVIIIVFFYKKLFFLQKKLKPLLEISFSKFFYLKKIKKEADNTQNSNSLKSFFNNVKYILIP